MAPDVAVEILSPSDWREHVDRKTALYLEAGTRLVIEIDPQRRTLTTHDATGSAQRGAVGILEHPAMPGFVLDLAALFSALDE